MAKNDSQIQEEVIFLPENLVRNSVGFSFDVGSSLTKTIYRSKKDFTDCQPINDEAVKNGLARVFLFKVTRESGCKPVTDIIRENCDIKRPGSPEKKLKVAVTGVGANLFKDELEKSLDLQLNILFEDDCGAVGFKLLADITPEEEFLYPLPEVYKQDAKSYESLFEGYFTAHGCRAVDNYSRLTHCERPIPEGTKPFLPCLLVTYGSGCIIGKLDANGLFTVTDINLVAGRSFLGFASYNHGPINFEELTSKLESADGNTVDALMSDLVDANTESDYALMKGDKRVLPFAKLINVQDRDKIKKEDLTLSYLRSLAEIQGHLAHVHALAHQVRKVYFIGGFVNMELMRRYLAEEIHGRNLLRPKSQQIEVHFVRQGGNMNAIGAFVEGSKSYSN